MLLSSKDGIICDLCGTIHKGESFVYYSADIDNYSIDKFKAKLSSNSFDVCETCFVNWKATCLKFIGKAKANTIKCDWCTNKYMSGKFTYSQIIIAKVSVNGAKPEITQKFMDYNICNKCHDKLYIKAEKIKKSKKGDWT